MQHDDGFSNPSKNRPFNEVLVDRLSRRQVLKGGLGTAAATFLTLSGAENVLAAGRRDNRPLLDFTPVPVAGGGGAIPRISPDYQYDVLIPWGEPLQPGGPVFNYPPSSADQALQIGIGHDGMWFFPFEKGKGHRSGDENNRGLLAINHEFGDNRHVFGRTAPVTLEDVLVSQHAHGVSVVEIRRNRGKWKTVNSPYARRIHVNSDVTFSGPVAGHPVLQTPAGNRPKGTVNNCGNGYTP